MEPYAAIRAALTDPGALVRAIGSGRQRNHDEPPRAEVRYVDLAAGRALQVTEQRGTQAYTANTPVAEGPDAVGAVADELLGRPYANWHVETTSQTLQLRVTKKGRPLVHVAATDRSQDTSHDRAKQRRIEPGEPFLAAVGIAVDGRIKPTRTAKYRQIEQFLGIVEASITDGVRANRLPEATERPLRIVDLGCGNAYLTFAVAAWLRRCGIPAQLTGIDVKQQSAERNTALADQLGWDDTMRFRTATIADAQLDDSPDVVLALHACDTATDDALSRAVGWRTPLILAAPCCHHDIQRQLKHNPAPAPYGLMTAHGILRERFADVLTDTLRAAVLRNHGYRVEVMEFVDSAHTPRNVLLRASRTGATDDPGGRDYEALTAQWQVRPRLADLLAGEPVTS